MSARPCICGCGRRGGHDHHVVYQQELRWVADGDRKRLQELRTDRRNVVPVAFDCHGAHHGASRRLSLHRLPDSVFAFASEVLGPEKGYEYLRRRYDGQDMRHERMLLETAA